MGKILLVRRLAARDLRYHVAQALLLLLAITAATTVLTLGLALQGVTNQPYQQTRTATKGPDVVAYLGSPGQATALIHASGVTAASGPYPLPTPSCEVNGHTAGAEVEGRTQAPAAVDRPDLTAGSWVRPGGVVIEREFAEALGVSVGDRLTLNGQSFTVAGIAVSAAKPPYPNICFAGGCEIYLNGIHAKNTGLIWATEPDAIKLPVAAEPLNTYVLDLKLADPDQAQAFASRYGPGPSGSTISAPASRPPPASRPAPSSSPGRTSPPRTHCWSATSKPSWCPAPRSFACSRWPAWQSWSEAGGRKTPGGSDCSRPQAARRA